MGSIEQKKVVVGELTEKFKTARATVVVDYLGVNAKQTTLLRKTLRENGVDYVVAKNTLLKRAADEAGFKDLEDYFTGVTAIAFSNDDEVKAANLIAKFIKDEKILKIKGGTLEDRVLDAKKVEILGSLPSKEALLSQVASCFLAPLQNVCYALEAVRKKAAGEDEATA